MFLLVPGISSVRQEQSAEESRKTELIAIFREKGIELSPSIDFAEACPAGAVLSRNPEVEKSKVSAIIGKSSVTDSGGNMLLYKADDGDAMLRGTGSFEMMLGPNAFAPNRSHEETANSFLKKLGLSLGGVMEETPREGNVTDVTVLSAYKDSVIFNARTKFTFNQDRMVVAEGIKPFDD